jgi:RNA polymerase sigma-70 factor (ECF subfamily)
MSPLAFEKLYNKLYLPLGMYALRIIGDNDMAQDVVQEAFVKVWQQIRSGFEPDDFRSYMYRTVHNGAISVLRSNSDTDSIDDFDSIYCCNEEAIDTSERDARLWRAIDSLPDRCREIFLLSKLNDLTYQQTADRLGISVKTVENQIGKALKALKGATKKIYLFFVS